MKKVIGLFTAIMITGTIFAQTGTSVPVINLSAERFKAASTDTHQTIIIDLRTSDEMKKGYIKGAVQLDFLAKDAESKIDKLDKTKTYFIYCESGERSKDAAEYMGKHGFKRTYTLEKGFSDWSLKGYPVEKK